MTARIILTSQQINAYIAGKLAYWTGKPLTSNPEFGKPILSYLWCHGWCDAAEPSVRARVKVYDHAVEARRNMMAQTIFVKGDTVRCVREKPSMFSYLGARPILRRGDLYKITDYRTEDGIEFYRVGNNVNWYHSSYFELHQRTLPFKEWSEF